MKGSNWIGNLNAPEPDPLQCYACQHPEVGYRHMCRESIDPSEIVTPEAIADWNRREEHRGDAYTARAGETVIEAPPGPTYDPAELAALVHELGEHIAGRIPLLPPRDMVWLLAHAIGSLERLAAEPGDAGDALRELSDLAMTAEEMRRLAAAPPAAASPAGSGTSPTDSVGAAAAAVPDPTGRRPWRPLRALRWPIAFAVGTAGFETAVMLGWLAW